MLTHQKTKPFVCIEQGCSKSYCDYRSLRRHYEVQHGLCILKEAPPEEEACGDSPHAHEVAGQPAPGGLRSLVPPEARSPGSLLPNRDLLRCIVSSIVHQKLPSPGPAPAGPPDSGEGRNTPCSCPPLSGSSSCAPGTLGPEVPEEPRPLRKEPAADLFTAVHARAAENNGPNPAESEPPLLQLPSSLEGWPEGSPLPSCLPLFRGQTVPAGAQPSGHSFQWLRNLPGCPQSKGNNMFVVHKPPSVPSSSREGSEPGPGLSSASPSGEPSPSLGAGLEDALPFPPSLLKAPGEASGDPRYASAEDDSWASKKSKFDCNSFSWQNPGEPGPQDVQKPGSLSSEATPLFRQLFLKSQEPLVGHEQMQVFQMITKSQRLFSHTQVPGPEGKQGALKALQGPWPLAPTVDSLHAGPVNPEPEGSPAHRRKSSPAFPREASPGSASRDAKGGPRAAAAPPALAASASDPPGNPDFSSLAKQLRAAKGTMDLGNVFAPGSQRQTPSGGDELPGAQLPGKQAQAEDGTASGATQGEKGPTCSRAGGYRLLSSNSRAQRLPGFRKEKARMDVCCAASPSQVAMASFSAGPPVDAPRDATSKLTIFNRIQVSSPAPRAAGSWFVGSLLVQAPLTGSQSSDAASRAGVGRGTRVQGRDGSSSPPRLPHKRPEARLSSVLDASVRFPAGGRALCPALPSEAGRVGCCSPHIPAWESASPRQTWPPPHARRCGAVVVSPGIVPTKSRAPSFRPLPPCCAEAQGPFCHTTATRPPSCNFPIPSSSPFQGVASGGFLDLYKVVHASALFAGTFSSAPKAHAAPLVVPPSLRRSLPAPATGTLLSLPRQSPVLGTSQDGSLLQRGFPVWPLTWHDVPGTHGAAAASGPHCFCAELDSPCLVDPLHS